MEQIPRFAGMTRPQKQNESSRKIRNDSFFSVQTSNFLQSAKHAGGCRELEWPNHPYPFGLQDEKTYHGHGAHEENDTVAAAVLLIFFFIFHAVHAF